MQYFVYSTLTNDHAYTNWTLPTEIGQRPEIKKGADGFKEQVLIKGGANVATDRLITPIGIRTAVTERQMETLKRNKTFQKHMAQGFIVVKTEKDDPEVIAQRHMEKADLSAPLTPKSEVFKEIEEKTESPLEVSVGKRITNAVRGILS